MRIPACLFILIAMTAHCLAAETFESLEQIVAPAGRPSGWKAGGKWNVVLVEEASARVQKAALKQTARIKLKMGNLESFEGAWRMKVDDRKVVIEAATVPVSFWVYFKRDAAKALSQTKAGTQVIVKGQIRRADIKLYSGNPVVAVDITEAEIDGTL